MIFDPPARSRRRVIARVLWPLLIAAAVILAVVVTAAGDETRIELEYLGQIRDQASELSRGGAAIREIMPRLRDVTREEFTTVFDGVVADVNVAHAFVAIEPPTKSLVPVWALYRQAVEAWDAGVSGISIAILQAADDPDDALVVNDIGDALAELRSGDALYRELQAEFDRAEIPDPVSPPVDVVLAPGEGGLLSLSASYVAAARASTNGLGLRPGLTVSQIISDPKWQPNVDGEVVIPATDTVTFSVVVTNTGNVASIPETLELTLNGAVEPVVRVVEVPALQVDSQTTVVFEPVEVLPDTAYLVTVNLVLSGLDSDPNDNTLSVQFTINEE